VSIFGTPNPRPLSGAEAAQRAAARDAAGPRAARDAKGRVRAGDEVDLTNVDDALGRDAVGRPGGNADEQTRQDRRRNPAYVRTKGSEKPKRPSLDVEG
jgi:hypothetical protein